MSIKQILLAVIAGLAVTLLLGFIPGTYSGVTGNLCDKSDENPQGLCYEQLRAAGVPLKFLFDDGEVSVVGKFGMEDKFKFPEFGFNVLIFSFFSLLVFSLVGRRKKPPQDHDQSRGD